MCSLISNAHVTLRIIMGLDYFKFQLDRLLKVEAESIWPSSLNQVRFSRLPYDKSASLSQCITRRTVEKTMNKLWCLTVASERGTVHTYDLYMGKKRKIYADCRGQPSRFSLFSCTFSGLFRCWLG